jgi:hypothetical protein
MPTLFTVAPTVLATTASTLAARDLRGAAGANVILGERSERKDRYPHRDPAVIAGRTLESTQLVE